MTVGSKPDGTKLFAFICNERMDRGGGVFKNIRRVHIHLRFLFIDFVSVNNHRVVFIDQKNA